MYQPMGEIVVPVQPITKPVWKTVGRYGGHWGGKTYQKFLKEITEPLESACKNIDILWEPLEVTIKVRATSPKKSKFPFPQGDWDNFSKAICDSLTGVLWIDDWQIKSGHLDKDWSDSGEPGYFSVQWETLPMDHKKFPIFTERKIQWELANG